MNEVNITYLILVGLLHDCGKTLIPPKILNAPRKLTVVEYEVIKNHVNYTYDLLHEFSEPVRLAASSHHERSNGKGYPMKLSNSEVSLEARIAAVADTYDAIVAQRAYQQPQSPFKALALLNSLRNREFDNDVVRIFMENMPDELVGKPVMMSDASIGIVREYDTDDIEFPLIEMGGKIIKSNKNLFPLYMYSED
jgi:HD-GYP domain-containing protein (c-di-GMP phosphodiesterase class II)